MNMVSRQASSPLKTSRGAVRAGVLAVLLLGALALLGWPTAPRADGPQRATYTLQRERAVVPQVVNVRALIQRYGPDLTPRGPRPLQVPPNHRREPWSGPAEPPNPFFVGPSASSPGGARGPSASGLSRGASASGAAFREFDTIPDQGGEPPDDGLAVGPNNIVSAANSAWAVFSKTSGNRQFIIPFVTWYQGVDTTGFIFDPRVDYDVEAQRFYLVTIGKDNNNQRSTMQISVSQTSDPLGNWFKYNFDVTESNPTSWLDYQTVGYNSQALFVSGNIFDFAANASQHSTFRIFNKARMLTGQSVTPTTIINIQSGGVGGFTIQPATSHDPTDVGWMIESLQGSAIRLWKVLNPLGASPTITTVNLTVPNFGLPPGMAQLGNNAVLDGGDARISNLILKNGQLWTSHHVGNNSSGTNRGEVRVYQMNPAGNGSLTATYTLSDSALDLHYPSLDMDNQGAVLVGMSAAAATISPSVACAIRQPGAASFSAPAILSQGIVSYTPKSSGNRWGDYSDSQFDPSDPTLVWHQNELAATTTTWKKRVFAVKTTPETLQVTSPNGGEIYQVGTDVSITWTQSGFAAPGNVRIDLSRDGGQSFPEVIAASTPNDGDFLWTVTAPTTDTARIRITHLTSATIFDTSDGDFQIVQGDLDVISPDGGEDLVIGDRFLIEWNATGFADTGARRVQIELSRDGGFTWEELFASTSNDGEEEWTVTGPPTSQALVRITTISALPFTDESAGTFRIREPYVITVLRPTNGALIREGEAVDIQWTTSSSVTGNLAIDLSRDGGFSWQTLFPNTPNDGSEQWIASGPATRLGRIRVRSLTLPDVSATSRGVFEIQIASLRVTSPNGGETFVSVGDRLIVNWITTGLPEESLVDIELSRNGGITWELIIPDTPNDGSAEWSITGAETSNALVRVTSRLDPNLQDVSDNPFSLATPTIRVVAPNGGEKLRSGEQAVIQWDGTTLGKGTVDIQLSRDGGATWATIIAATANDGGQTWGVAGAGTTKARIRIIWNSQSSIRDDSNSNFSISATGRSGGTGRRGGRVGLFGRKR